MNNRILMAILAGTVVCGGAAFVAVSAIADSDREDDEIARLPAPPVTLTDAVARTEARFGGRAVSAILRHVHGTLSYEIELVNGAVIREVELSASTGEVISSRDDRKGDDDDNDDDDADDARP